MSRKQTVNSASGTIAEQNAGLWVDSMKFKAIVVVMSLITPCHAEWKISSFNDRMTDSTIKTATVAAKAPDHAVSATIRVSCLRDKVVGGLIVSIETDAVFTLGRMGLTYRLDNDEPTPRYMQVDANGRGMSLWMQPEEFPGKKRLRVQLEPARSPNLFFEFDISGVEKALAAVPCKRTRAEM
ncbi:hypothetical protein [Bradyrhizobium acaciae]|uniref:hypothetical protein n=1 Tax=Bradyrhizobium acaciae TaxID=2683706 RepID=UPI001E483CCB|nr:hypothetical protein [Bradyrhizobium acaciae]MCC8980821.1 hypothetical protein [Bradyrhizobium acaciae]